MGHVSPEAAVGGPIATIRTGDLIRIDIAQRSLEVELSPAEMARCLAAHEPRPREIPAGYMRRYADQVSSAARSAGLS